MDNFIHCCVLSRPIYQFIVFISPSSMLVLALNPKSRSALDTSIYLRRCPSGFVASHSIFPVYPVNSLIFSVSSLMVTSSSSDETDCGKCVLEQGRVWFFHNIPFLMILFSLFIIFLYPLLILS